MGLDFSHGEADFSYGGFRVFREALAEHEGFDLREMIGYDGTRSWDTVDTPLKPLLNHSDCEGDLSPEECAQVYPRLREICLVLFSKPGDYPYKTNWEMLADAMEYCAEHGETLEFC